MSREEPEKYQLFRNLKISAKVLDLWFKELLDEIATKVLNDETKKNDWISITNYIEIMQSLKSNIEEYVKKMFTLLEYASKNSDSKQKIIIMESLSGRTISQKDGGIYFVNHNTFLGAEMKKVLIEFINFDPDFVSNEEGWYNPKLRYEQAKKKMMIE